MNSYKLQGLGGINRTLTEQEILDLLASNKCYFSIRQLYNPSEDLQLAFVRKNELQFQYIKNPTEKVIQLHKMLWEI